jgi:hypothetical protein
MAGFFDTLFSGGAQKDAATKDYADLQQYQGQALPALQQAYGTGTTAINQGIQDYAPLAALGAQYSGAAPTVMNALGLGGQAGMQSAMQAFQNNNPGYQFALNQALQAAQRNASTGGMTTSGNLLQALQSNATNLANQNYQNWFNNLSNTAGMGAGIQENAAAGQAGGEYNLANLAQNYGQSQSNIYGNVASGEMNANQMVAQGQAQGASNLLGAGLSLATLGLGGNPFGGGSLMGGKGGTGGTGGSFNLASTPIGQIGSGIGNFFGGLFNQGSSTA